MAAVKSLCTRGIVLEHGKVNYVGDIETAINLYYIDLNEDLQPFYKGNGIIKEVYFSNTEIEWNSSFKVFIKFDTEFPFQDLVVGLLINNKENTPIMAVNNKHYLDSRINKDEIKKGIVSVEIENFNLFPGDYKLDVFIGDGYVDKEKIEEKIFFKVDLKSSNQQFYKINKNMNKIIFNKVKWNIQN
jgi:lipopolysaccharide transport system ATP-binding protein